MVNMNETDNKADESDPVQVASNLTEDEPKQQEGRKCDEHSIKTTIAKRKKQQISISDYFTKRRKMSAADDYQETPEKRRELLAVAAEKRQMGQANAKMTSSISLFETEAERQIAGAGKEPISNHSVKVNCDILKEETAHRVRSSSSEETEQNAKSKSVSVTIPKEFYRDGSEYLTVLTPGPEHTILFRPHILPNKSPAPFPDEYRDYWDKYHVRMPCSAENLYPTLDKKVQKRWELIEATLLQTFQSSNDLEEAILVYNHHYKNKWNFESWHSYCNIELNEYQREDLFSNVLPSMVTLALQLPSTVTQAPKLLVRGKDHKLTLSQKQIACLLANAFFCTFPRRNSLKSSEYCNYPDINFSRMFRGIKDVVNLVKTEKIKCILNYFKRVLSSEGIPTGTVTFHRKVLCTNDVPQWDNSDKEFRDLYVSSDGTIEDHGNGLLQVDFANRMIGGGVVGEGCVQEEIRFLMCPEMIVSRLFTERLDANESLLIVGAERYSLYTGYAQTFRYNGNFNDFTPRDRWGRKKIEVVAIDAHVFHCYADQLKTASLKRELEKAYCGFRDSSNGNLPAVATGNWGCGAFGGDIYLKALLQMMAATQANRDIAYFTFADEKFADELREVHAFLCASKVQLKQLWKYLVNYGQQNKTSSSHLPLYPFLRKLHESYETDTDDGASSCNEENPLEIRGVPCEIPPDMSPVSPDYNNDTP